MKTRSRTEIIRLILQAVEVEPLTRSKIMYRAMLNFTQVKDYTSFLTQQGLLRYVMLDKKYAITDQGRQFLTLSNESNHLLMALDGDYDSGVIDSDEGYTRAADNLKYRTSSNSNKSDKRRRHYTSNYSNDKRVFTCGCTVEWHLDKIKFTDCTAHLDKVEEVIRDTDMITITG